MVLTDRSDAPARSSPQNIYTPAHSQDQSASTPLEMSSLPSNDLPQTSGQRQSAGGSEAPVSNSSNLPLTSDSSPQPPQADPAKLTRMQSTAIGPSLDEPLAAAKDADNGPTLMITLLLINGARHPFKLDAKYLNRRNVQVQENNPYNLSVYKLKELILREWREEWEAKPSSPSSIRLISFGKLLDDKAPLTDSKFNQESPNVVHMTVKPQDMLDEEEAGGKGGKSNRGSGDGEERSPRCRCVVM